MEFGRRVAIEKDIERNEANYFNNLVFDESGMFLLYGSLLGVKRKKNILYFERILDGPDLFSFNKQIRKI